MRELLGGKGTISLLDCSADNAPNTEFQFQGWWVVTHGRGGRCGAGKVSSSGSKRRSPGIKCVMILESLPYRAKS
jgi:hypothetical protein